MSFPKTTSAIGAMIRGAALETSTSRDIMRKAGFRPGALTEGVSGGEKTVLSVSPYRAFDLAGVVHDWPPSSNFHHATSWDLSLFSRTRMSVPVESTSGAGATLLPVWAESYADLVAGDWQLFGDGVAIPERGFYKTAWQPIPADALSAGEVVLAFMLDATTSIDWLRVGVADLRLWTQGDLPPGGETLSFYLDAPGNLTFEDGQYYADYDVLSGNFGYSDAAAEALIDSILQSASGWSQAGVTFRNVPGADVTFQFVEDVVCGPHETAVGCTVGTTVTLQYARAAAGFATGMTTHEAGHAFFGIGHSGNGVMSGESPDGYPTDSDIQSVIDWLAS